MFKTLKSFLFAVALCLATAGAANAATCNAWCNPPSVCSLWDVCCCGGWTPTPTSGFVLVSSSYAVQDGEAMFCTNGGTWCQKTALGPGGFYNGNLSADWQPGGIAPVYTVTSRLHRSSTLYAGSNFTGSSFSWGPQFNPQYGPTHPTVNPMSFSLNN